MLNYKIKTAGLAAGAALALGAATPANAAAILGLYDTGVDKNGVVLAPGAEEQHYILTGSSNPLLAPLLPKSPTVATYSQWSANDAAGSTGSSWISPFTNAAGTATGSGQRNHTYDYALTFNLGTLSATSAVISGRVQSDNFVEILLNGVALPAQAQAPVPFPGVVNYFRKFSAFGVTNGFQAGQNTLTFRVTDYGSVTGLRVSDLVGTAVPEPATWAMLIVGFGLVAGQVRRRRRAGTLAIA